MKKFIIIKRYIYLLSFFICLFLLFYFIFFIVFATLSIDGLIGFNLIVLFLLIYRNFGQIFNSYFLNITKTIFINFYNLISLVIELQTLVLNILISYKNLFEYKFLLINYIYYDVKKIFNNYNKYLLRLCFNNFVLNIFFNKINLIQNFNKTKLYLFMHNKNRINLISIKLFIFLLIK